MSARSDQKIAAEIVAAQAALGKTAREIAEEGGVTRQLIYRIARQNDITLPSGFARYRELYATGVQRVVTGGIPDGSRIAIGAASEMLAAADLLARGWSVYLPIRRDKHHDLIACKYDMVLTIEVKSGTRRSTGSIQYNKDVRGQSAHHAIVLRNEPVVYEPPLPD